MRFNTNSPKSNSSAYSTLHKEQCWAIKTKRSSLPARMGGWVKLVLNKSILGFRAVGPMHAY